MSEQGQRAVDIGDLTVWMVTVTIVVAFVYLWIEMPDAGTGVGRSTGYAVVEQHDTSWVTTDPSWNPVVDPDGCGCVPLPEAATP